MITFSIDRNPQWEQITLQLISQLQEERQNAQRRLAETQRTIDDLEHHLAALDTAMRMYRQVAGLPPVPVTTESPDEYRNLTTKDMLIRWADFHQGTVVMKEAAKGLAALGLFKDGKQAAATLYPTVRRHTGTAFRQLARGVYAPSDAPVMLRRRTM